MGMVLSHEASRSYSATNWPDGNPNQIESGETMMQTTRLHFTMGDYADALQFLPKSWERQDVDQVKMTFNSGKLILVCADYAPIIFDNGQWKEIRP